MLDEWLVHRYPSCLTYSLGRETFLLFSEMAPQRLDEFFWSVMEMDIGVWKMILNDLSDHFTSHLVPKAIWS